MPQQKKPDQIIRTYSLENITENRILELKDAFGKNQGWVVDRAMEIAYPVLKEKAERLSQILQP